ncbi:DUF1161 domain-containing protein [Yokenella regensburgei]|uniref:DUF1161 domain-containing protein n=1 Tax=Yokenella regensburgei TaxID=158877 RepID=UPI003F18B3CC
MKHSLWLGAVMFTLSASAFAAPDSCERVKNDIQQKIINNGVPESGFTLTVEPNDQSSASDAQVVGHCANDGWKILYTRSGNNQTQSGEISQSDTAQPASQ